MECEQHRHLVLGVEALGYLRADGLGLSRVVGYLLDPRGQTVREHGFATRSGIPVGPDRCPADRTVQDDENTVEIVREQTGNPVAHCCSRLYRMRVV